MKKYVRMVGTGICCPPLLEGNLTYAQAEQLGALLRVLSEPARLYMVSLIAVQPNQEVCACELVETLGLSQPTVSHHLKVLHEAGILTKERRGLWIYYRLVPDRIATLANIFS